MSNLEDDMHEHPERIWIEQDNCPYFYEESELAEVGSPVTEYIRADLCNRRAFPSCNELETVAFAEQFPNGRIEVVQVHKGRHCTTPLVTRQNAEEVIGRLEKALKNERELSAKKSEQIRHWRNAWHEENNKLAQIKLQEPVGYRKALSDIDGHFTYSNKNLEGDWQPLYASPIDQTAEIESLREKYQEAVRNAFKDSKSAEAKLHTADNTIADIANELGCKPYNEEILQTIFNMKSKLAEYEKQMEDDK